MSDQFQAPNNLAAFSWSIADLLRGDFKQSQYGRIILPFTLLRRLEGVLEETKDAVLAEYEKVKKMNLAEEAQEKLLLRATKTSKNKDGLSFFNTSKIDLSKLGEIGIKANLESYIQGFSKDAREIFEYFNFAEFIGQLNDSDLLYKVVQKVRKTDLGPKAISNHDMGLTFEELIRRFAEGSNETAGEHFTPRDIARLTTALVFMEDDDALTKSGIIRTIYDPTAGTGGFLSSGMEYLHELNPQGIMKAFGQELNPESYAICKANMLIKGQDASAIHLGNSLSEDMLPNSKFDYMVSNPPWGLDWKKIQKEVTSEYKSLGLEGRFGPGLPRVSDGTLLFVMHLVSKLREKSEGGGKIGVIVNGSCLFAGDAGSGESEIRRFLIESDLLEAIIALPEGMYFNTGIKSYILIISNKKSAASKNRVQVINATDLGLRMRKRIGSKKHYLDESAIKKVLEQYSGKESVDWSKMINGSDFGYRKVQILVDGNKEFENVPLSTDVNAYLASQLNGVHEKYSIDRSYVDEKDNVVGRIGYEFNLDFIDENKSEGKQFRSYFEEVSLNEDWSFYLNRTCNKAVFKTKYHVNSKLPKAAIYFKVKSLGSFDFDYLKYFFESDSWEEWLVTYKSNATANIQNKYELLRRKIIFPTIAEQRKVVEVLDGIEKWGVRLGELRKDVWKTTSGGYSEKKYRLPVSKDLQEQVVDIAPYPIANIIHHYKNLKDTDYKSKYELLLKLFECLAIFQVSIFVPFIDEIIEPGSQYLLLNGKKGKSGSKNQLKNASFGKWVYLLGDISNLLKQSTSVSKTICIEHGLDDSLLKCFQDAVVIRNETSGHGSYPTKSSARETLLKVEKLYDRFMEAFYGLFENYTLIRPINGTWNGEYNKYQVEEFSGLGSYPFGLRDLETKSQLIDGELYLVLKDGKEVYKLFPFVRLIDLDSDSGLEAFYFYSKKVSNEDTGEDNNEFLYISHQQINKQSQLFADIRLTSIFK